MVQPVTFLGARLYGALTGVRGTINSDTNKVPRGSIVANQQFRKWLHGLAVAAVMALGASGPAQAIVYKGSFDPAFTAGGSGGLSFFSNLSWSGEALFTIPCSTGSCTGTMDSATVTLVDSVAGTQTLSFTGPVGVSSTRFGASSNLLGVNSGYFDYQPAASLYGGDYAFTLMFFDNGSTANVKLFYQRIGGGCDDDDDCDADSFESSSLIGPYGHGGDDHEDDEFKGCAPPSASILPTNNTMSCGVSSVAPTDLVFAPIPEPETYALMLAGLAAVGFMARRRRR